MGSLPAVVKEGTDSHLSVADEEYKVHDSQVNVPGLPGLSGGTGPAPATALPSQNSSGINVLLTFL